MSCFILFVFLKEIDAITAPSQPAENTVPSTAPPPTPPRPEPKESASSLLLATANGTDQVAEWQYDTQCSLSGGELHVIACATTQSCILEALQRLIIHELPCLF